MGSNVHGSVTRSRKLLDLAKWVEGDHALYVQIDEDNVAENETELRLDFDLFESFGRPAQLTVTVQPGDLLNA